MRAWRLAALAFAAMCVQDVLGTCMVIFEARLNGPVAGAFDAAGWLANLTCAGIALDEIIKNGWRTRKSLMIIGAVTAANFAGTVTGVTIGAALTRHH